MRFLKRIIYILLLFIPLGVKAQDCRCIEISLGAVQKETGTVTFKVKNTCMRRIWFSTRGFWMTMSDKQEANTQSRLYKLTNTDKKFILFGWKDEKEISFQTDKLNGVYDNLHFSYSNTTDPQPKSLFGSKTYLCEVDIK